VATQPLALVRVAEDWRQYFPAPQDVRGPVRLPSLVCRDDNATRLSRIVNFLSPSGAGAFVGVGPVGHILKVLGLKDGRFGATVKCPNGFEKRWTIVFSPCCCCKIDGLEASL